MFKVDNNYIHVFLNAVYMGRIDTFSGGNNDYPLSIKVNHAIFISITMAKFGTDKKTSYLTRRENLATTHNNIMMAGARNTELDST